MTHIPEFDDSVVEQDVRQAVRNLKQVTAVGFRRNSCRIPYNIIF